MMLRQLIFQRPILILLSRDVAEIASIHFWANCYGWSRPKNRWRIPCSIGRLSCKSEGALLTHRCGVHERGGAAQSQIITTISEELSAEPQDRIAIVIGRTRGRSAREGSAVSTGLEFLLAPRDSET